MWCSMGRDWLAGNVISVRNHKPMYLNWMTLLDTPRHTLYWHHSSSAKEKMQTLDTTTLAFIVFIMSHLLEIIYWRYCAISFGWNEKNNAIFTAGEIIFGVDIEAHSKLTHMSTHTLELLPLQPCWSGALTWQCAKPGPDINQLPKRLTSN